MIECVTKEIEVNINEVRPGDYIKHDGKVVGIGPKDIKYNTFMGTTVLGDSYHLGHKPVIMVLLHTWRGFVRGSRC
jgi:hypothetical protein